MTAGPNVLLLTIDTLRQDRLGCYGHGRPTTPCIDRFAASALQFSQAISGGPWTQAAFPVMLTSTYASMYGGCLGRLSTERPSPIEILADHGYLTGGFSTNPHLSRANGYDRGFQHFQELAPSEEDPPLRRIRGGQRLLRSRAIQELLRLLGKRFRPARISSSATSVTDAVCHWLDRAQAPFFLWAHYMDVHWPYHIEERLTRPGEIAQAWRDLEAMHVGANWRRRRALTQPEQDHLLELYERALRYLDAEVGRLLSYLDRSGRGENTVVILTADHGEEFLDHGRWGHWESNLFDELLKVPLLIRLPGTPAARVDHQVRLLDLMPTVLELCGCSMPSNLEGVSMTPLWSPASSFPYTTMPAVSERHRPPWHRIAVRSDGFKYIWDNSGSSEAELYHLVTDPGESRNVSDQHPREVERLHTVVEAQLLRAAQTTPTTVTEEPPPDGEVTRRLQALGYVE